MEQAHCRIAQISNGTPACPGLQGDDMHAQCGRHHHTGLAAPRPEHMRCAFPDVHEVIWAHADKWKVH